MRHIALRAYPEPAPGFDNSVMRVMIGKTTYFTLRWLVVHFAKCNLTCFTVAVDAYALYNGSMGTGT